MYTYKPILYMYIYTDTMSTKILCKELPKGCCIVSWHIVERHKMEDRTYNIWALIPDTCIKAIQM